MNRDGNDVASDQPIPISVPIRLHAWYDVLSGKKNKSGSYRFTCGFERLMVNYLSRDDMILLYDHRSNTKPQVKDQTLNGWDMIEIHPYHLVLPYYRADAIRSKELIFFFAHSLAEIIALLFVIDSINWTNAMIHTQHELPPMSDERNKISSFNRMASAR